MEKKDESTSGKILSFELGKKVILEKEAEKIKNSILHSHGSTSGKISTSDEKEANEIFSRALVSVLKEKYGEDESIEVSDEKLDSKILYIESQQNVHITSINKNIMKKVLNGIVGFVLIPAVSVLVSEILIWLMIPPSKISTQGVLYNIILRCPGVFMGLTFGMSHYLLKGEKKQLNSQTTEDPKKEKTLLRKR